MYGETMRMLPSVTLFVRNVGDYSIRMKGECYVVLREVQLPTELLFRVSAWSCFQPCQAQTDLTTYTTPHRTQDRIDSGS